MWASIQSGTAMTASQTRMIHPVTPAIHMTQGIIGSTKASVSPGKSIPIRRAKMGVARKVITRLPIPIAVAPPTLPVAKLPRIPNNVPPVEFIRPASPNPAIEARIILCPSWVRAAKGSVQLVLVGDIASVKAPRTRSDRFSPRMTFSMIPMPSSPGDAPLNSSALPPGASMPSVVCT